MTVTFVWTFSWSTGILIFHHRVVKFPDKYYKMEKTLSEEERQRINVLLEKHQPREETKEKEMVVLSEKGREIRIKTEVAIKFNETFWGTTCRTWRRSLKKEIWSHWYWYWDGIWRYGYWRWRTWSEKINQKGIRDISSIQGILHNSGKN